MPRKVLPYELDMTKFKDSSIAAVVDELVKKYINTTCNNNPYCHIRSMNTIYTGIFADVCIEDISAEFVRAMLTKQTHKETLYTYYLLISLLEKGLIQDARLYKLLSFKDRLCNKGYKKDFSIIIDSDIYDILKESGDLESAQKIFFMPIDDIPLKNERIKALTEKYLHLLKTNTDYTVAVRGQKCYAIKEIARYFFLNADATLLTRQQIADYIKSKTRTGCDIVGLFDYLMFLNNTCSFSEEVKELFLFADYYKTPSSSEKIIEMCESPNVKQYVLVKKEDGMVLYKFDLPSGTSLFDALKDFTANAPYRCKAFTTFLNEFYISSGKTDLSEICDLSFDTFLSSTMYFSKYKELKYFSFLFAFYNYCYGESGIDFFAKQNLSIKLLVKPGLAKFLAQGYEIVRYNSSEDVPCHDKWLLCYNKDYETNTEHPVSETIAIDFTQIDNTTFREWSRYYVWKNPKGIISKRSMVHVLAYTFNYIHALRTGKELSVYCKNREAINAVPSAGEIMALKAYVTHFKNNPRTANTVLYTMRAMLQFLKDNGVADIPSGTFYHMYHQNTLINTAVAIPDDHLEMLNKHLLSNAEKSVFNDICYTIFYIALETEFRISQIVSLRADCLHEAAKKSQYIVVSKKKDELSDAEEQAITIYTKRHIDHVLEITADIRNKAFSDTKDFLFLVPQNGTVPVRVITRENFRKYMKACCDELGLPSYTAENLRDTHMTKAREYKIKHQLSDIEHSTLTGHRVSNLDLEHYVDMSVKAMMEALHGVIIGSVDITGEIVKKVPEHIATVENEVSNGCGFCKNVACNNLTYLDCILCKHFVTMPSRLPYFEEQVTVMDERIKSAKTPHDKEDYVNIKRLLVGYICAIKEFMKNEEDIDD